MSRRPPCIVLTIALLAGCSAEPPTASSGEALEAQQRLEVAWEVIHLPGPAGSVPSDINDLGQIAGEIEFPSGRHAVIWEPDGSIVDLGTLGGAFSTASAINNRGEVVGSSSTADGRGHAFVWDRKHGMIDITPDAINGYAADINLLGSVVGAAKLESGPVGFLWDERNGLTTIDGLGWYEGGIQPSGINIRNEIVGSSNTADGFMHAFYWSFRTGTRDLGALGGTFGSEARGINNAGQIVGFSRVQPVSPGIGRPVPWILAPNGTVRFLPILGGQGGAAVYAMNAFGAAVGYYWDTSKPPYGFLAPGVQTPVFWNPAGAIESLPMSPDARMAVATAINDRGDVVGIEVTPNNRAVMWRRVLKRK